MLEKADLLIGWYKMALNQDEATKKLEQLVQIITDEAKSNPGYPALNLNFLAPAGIEPELGQSPVLSCTTNPTQPDGFLVDMAPLRLTLAFEDGSEGSGALRLMGYLHAATSREIVRVQEIGDDGDVIDLVKYLKEGVMRYCSGFEIRPYNISKIKKVQLNDILKERYNGKLIYR